MSLLKPSTGQSNRQLVTDMPPPILSAVGNVKTPCLDLTAGFKENAVVKKLQTLNVAKLDAFEMLRNLQSIHQLYTSPFGLGIGIRFPFLVVEGKSYSTGNSMYNTKNQAMISRSCIIVLQQQFAKFVKDHSSDFQESKEPLAFSVCHEGPMINLQFHYMTMMGNACFYNSRVVFSYHATVPLTVRPFFIALFGVMEWARNELLDNMFKQLLALV